MEAMACGCAVVASDVGGNPELIENGVRGLLFESGNAAALAESLTKLIDNESLRRGLAAEGERFIREGFPRQASAARMGEIYESFLRE
jgi:glycosyltransferase involved in cell wall biosynthesis